MRVLISAAETGGPLARLRFALPPGAAGPPLHVHRRVEETFTVLDGALDVAVGPTAQQTEHRRLDPGDAVAIGVGVVHRFWNAGAGWALFDAEVRSVEPGAAARFETAMRAVYGLAADGEARPDGFPRRATHALLAIDGLDLHLPGLPVSVDRAVERLALRPLIRAVGRTETGRAFTRYNDLPLSS